ncbi:MAG: dTDP-4-dehydrorhamnose reductase [Archangium sp.]|nr:dTDP-4-dehydrorhamnose reductase [Archangium sp.]MDP3569797.1 dTDP-4-dehydrorhamnose reductase [Archangium sp.]
MRILVTGANGLVAGRLLPLLASKGHEVIGLGRGPQRAPGGTYLSMDLGDAQKLSSAVQELRPQVIINCAAMTDVDGCERDPLGAYTANVEGVATLARSARELGSHLLHVSTDYVFDGDAGPYDIDAIPNPRGTYAITKHAGEEAARALLPKGSWTIARTAVVYGWPSTGKNNFGSWLIDALSNGKNVKLFTDQWVSPTHASNAAEMLAELAERRLAGIWHTSGADVVDRVAFGRALCARFGFDSSLIQPSRMADVNLPSPRPAKSGLNVSRTSEALSAKPLSLEAALARLYAEYKGSTS